MKVIKQKVIAEFIGISPQMICDIRKGRRFLSKAKAKEISEKTGIPFEVLAMTNGEQLYKKFVFALHSNDPQHK